MMTEDNLGPRINLEYVAQWLRESLEGVTDREEAHVVLHRYEVEHGIRHLERALEKLEAQND